MTTATTKDWSDSARVEHDRQRRETAIKSALLDDFEGTESAFIGCLHFLNGGEGERIEGLDGVLLSPSAAKFYHDA